LAIPPDQDFILARLQKIDIHALISSGEICTSIDASHTQDALARAVHTCEPSPSNREWIVDRDKLNHSTGTTQVSNHLIWHVPEPPVIPSYFHPDSPEANKVKIVPGAAIYIVNDPLGRLIQTAEFMVDEHLKYMDYVEKHGEKYTLAKLVGNVLESCRKNGNDYTKHVDDLARCFFIKFYEERRDSYEALMKESTVLLKFWYQAADDSKQWNDFYRIGEEKNSIKLIATKYNEITQNIYSAFMLTPEGIGHLQNEVKNESSRLNTANSQAVKWLSAEAIVGLTKNTLSIIAATANVDDLSLEKIRHVYEAATHTTLNARIVEIPESELIAHHRAMALQHAPPISTKLKVESGLVTKIPSDLTLPSSQKMIKIVEFEGVPVYKLQTLVSSLPRELSIDDQRRVEKISKDVKAKAPLRAALSALLILNTRSLIHQIDKLQTEGNLAEGTFSLYHAEILRNALVISELSIETVGLMTRKIAGEKLADGAMRIAKRLSLPAMILTAFIDVFYIKNYTFTGESKLQALHVISLGSVTIAILMHLSSRLAMSRPLGMIGLALGVTAAFGIFYLTKNDIERWLFQGEWGNTKDKKDEPKRSIEWFHFMIPQVHVKSFTALDKRGVRINDDLERSFEERFGFESSYPLKQPESFCWEVQFPKTDNIFINLSLLVMTTSGMPALLDNYIEVSNMPNSEGLMQLKITVSSQFFHKHGVLGRLLFQVEDSKSGNFLGKDAYEFELNLVKNAYECKKVLYGSHS
jgi:hypothetical protein